MRRVSSLIVAYCLLAAALLVVFAVVIPPSAEATNASDPENGKITDNPRGEIEIDVSDGITMPEGGFSSVVRLEGDSSASGGAIKPFCSGVLIAPRYVLTAAHCIVDQPWEYQGLIQKSGLQVRFGNLKNKPTIKVVRSAYWRDFNRLLPTRPIRQSDIAVLQLSESAPVQPARLAEVDPNQSANVTMLGYGRSTANSLAMSDNLLYGDAVISPFDACSDGLRRPAASQELCTTVNKDSFAGACPGDSGGPLLSPQSEAVIAIASWSKRPTNCDSSAIDRFSVFARVDSARDWLLRQTGAPLFGRAAIASNTEAPVNPQASITSLSARGLSVKYSAEKWRSGTILIQIKAIVSGQTRYWQVRALRGANSNRWFWKAPIELNNSKTESITVSMKTRFYNHLYNGTTTPTVYKVWRRQ